ncbi:hypothetical protein ACCO45_009911 [Purpureocillium lilacinum]|uniref:Uncharacterized protein n=1 Tax=Purpureocillium lilacinum TaxID=33203 RepID=A0ACC4DE58_PURLI
MGEQLFAQRARQTEQNELGAQRSLRSQDAPPPYLSNYSPKIQAWTLATNRKATPYHGQARRSRAMAGNQNAENQLQNTGRRTIRVFQANVGKIPPAHDCALALADAEQYDVVLLQGLWTESKEGRCPTKTHSSYDKFTPVDSWINNSTCPRVMTYVRHRPGLTADQQTSH